MKQITGFYVPLSTWKEITQEEAHTAYQQGIPVLLYSEHSWDQPKGAARAWGANRNMRVIIYRLEFFGPRMDEQGYQVKEAEGKGEK